jgi:hypothetical protein
MQCFQAFASSASIHHLHCVQHTGALYSKLTTVNDLELAFYLMSLLSVLVLESPVYHYQLAASSCQCVCASSKRFQSAAM